MGGFLNAKSSVDVELVLYLKYDSAENQGWYSQNIS